MRLIWAVLCESVIIDSQSNRPTLVNVLEELNVSILSNQLPEEEQRPLFPLPCAMVVLWARDDDATPETHEVRVRIVDQQSEQQLAISAPLVAGLQEHLRSRTIFRLPGIPALRDHLEGGIRRYNFAIEARSAEDEWVERGVVPLRIVISDEAAIEFEERE